MICGYARISTDSQSVAGQVKKLCDIGGEQLFRETTSGAESNPVQLRRALAQLNEPVREITHDYDVHHSTISRLQPHV